MCETDRLHLSGSLTRGGTARPPRDVMRTPAAAADRLLLRYNNKHDHGAGWEATQMHPAALIRELRQRDWLIVDRTHVPTAEASYAE